MVLTSPVMQPHNSTSLANSMLLGMVDNSQFTPSHWLVFFSHSVDWFLSRQLLYLFICGGLIIACIFL